MQTEREQKAWQQELDKKVEELFGEHIYLRLLEGNVSDLTELRLLLTEKEYEFIKSQLRQAVVDYQKFTKRGWNGGGVIIGNYPKLFKIENGNRGLEKRQCLLQIFI